jgi:phosphopantothenoylcysteine synthetase/decarboxylase
MKILITYGGTVEPIDNVRHITNFSSGNTGRRVAEYCAAHGAEVTALCSPTAAKLTRNDLPITVKHFTDFKSIFRMVEEELATGTYDVMIHAAAVSDYTVSRIVSGGAEIPVAVGKIPSGQNVTLELVPTPKIIARVKEWAPGVRLFGFKLTDTPDVAHRFAVAEKVLATSGAEAVILNDLSEVKGERHGFTILPTGVKGETLDDLCKAMGDMIL